jgi:hypothetical protein
MPQSKASKIQKRQNAAAARNAHKRAHLEDVARLCKANDVDTDGTKDDSTTGDNCPDETAALPHEHNASASSNEDDLLVPNAAMLEEAREEYDQACNHDHVSTFVSFIKDAQEVFASLDHQRRTTKQKPHYNGNLTQLQQRQRAVLKKMRKGGYPSISEFFQTKSGSKVSAKAVTKRASSDTHMIRVQYKV